ncbi:MAG: NUDIX domain-containing protein [Anaerolineales bacterium]|jgi:8-oxo-dGTP pyrophosphatase MutT (NUDIX family)
MRARFPVTVHLFLIREGRILLLRRFNTGYEDGNYSVPAGHLDGGESVRDAAVREALEEIGVEIRQQDLNFAGVMHRNSDDERVDFFLEVKTWMGEPSIMEPEKSDDLQWLPIQDLPNNTIPYIRRALSNFITERTYDEFGWEL